MYLFNATTHTQMVHYMNIIEHNSVSLPAEFRQQKVLKISDERSLENDDDEYAFSFVCSKEEKKYKNDTIVNTCTKPTQSPGVTINYSQSHI